MRKQWDLTEGHRATTVRMPLEIHTKVKFYSDSQNLSFNYAVNEILTQHFEDNPVAIPDIQGSGNSILEPSDV